MIGPENIRALKHVSLYMPLDSSAEMYEHFFYDDFSRWDKNVISKYLDTRFKEHLLNSSHGSFRQLQLAMGQACVNALEQLQNATALRRLSLTAPDHHKIFRDGEATFFLG